MKNIILILLSSAFLFVSCSDFLEIKPKGTVSEESLYNIEGAEKLVTAAYASLGNDHWHEPYTSLWPYGNVRAGDAYKGGLGAADQGEYHTYETFAAITPQMDKSNRIWGRLYIAVTRANAALNVLNEIPNEDMPNKIVRQAEMRLLRGHFHFILKILFKKIPYITDGLTADEVNQVPNSLPNDDLWNKIGEDFQFAIDNLPLEKESVGRSNKVVAKAYLAKLRLYQAYEQDEKNNVVNINKTLLEQVVSLVDDIINSGQYGLHEDYAYNYLWDYDNGIESLFAVQRSRDDGTPVGRLDVSNALNYPMYPGYACCSFHRPSFNLVSAFQTTEGGLPMFSTYNNGPKIETPVDFDSRRFDPRLDHTVGVPGHPYKYMLEVIYTSEQFTREPGTYGPFSAMKEVQQLDCPCLSATKQYAYPASSKNNDIIKYSDVLLWKAEALIELGRQDEALPIINQIRSRAKNSTKLLEYPDGSFFANYTIEEYKPGENIQWTQVTARECLRWERRLEFALEGIRFFDLTRWGIAAESLDGYFQIEKSRVPHLDNAKFTKNRDEYLPIPNQQIDLSQGVYVQNNGW
jgi:tetratricopeptide (TPR) repeat protein